MNISKSCIEKIFPKESIEYIAKGVKSVAFRTNTGKIIRVKPFYYGTYDKEHKILDYIEKKGGIGCSVPQLSVFTRKIFSFSVHDEIQGEILDIDRLLSLSISHQRYFAEQLAEALIKLWNLPFENTTDSKAIRKLFYKRAYYFFLDLWHSIRISRILKRKNLWRTIRGWSHIVKGSCPKGLVHGDLHRYNMIATEDCKLSGVIDFGGVKFRPFEHNLRKIPNLIRDMVRDYCDANMPEKLCTHKINYYRMQILVKYIVKPKTTPEERKNLIAELDSLFQNEVN
jgi:aminoglycoside phosphotransferase (APT) family kinase protein